MKVASLEGLTELTGELVVWALGNRGSGPCDFTSTFTSYIFLFLLVHCANPLNF